MYIVRFRSSSDSKEVIKKLKKMHKFTKELIECIEHEEDDDDDYDDEIEYRHTERGYYEDYPHERRGGGRGRYRRSM